jgi:16S rRNA (cytidine1402-2'-O)-methyltransferase
VTTSEPDGRLSVVATPIGNLGDISPRARETLRTADLIACEDTRRTGLLMQSLGAKRPMVSLHAHNELARIPELLARIGTGERVALVTDAGMPAVSDPGSRLISAAHDAGIRVEVLPGPSAVTAAIAVSGAPADRFVFAGFMPRKAGERAHLFTELDRTGWPVVGFESPQRLAGLVAALAVHDPERRIAICREISKLHEETLTGSASELASRLASTPVRGEITIVIWPPAADPDRDRDAGRVDDAVRVLLDAGLGPSQCADVAAALGIGPRNRAYRSALAEAKRRNR